MATQAEIDEFEKKEKEFSSKKKIKTDKIEEEKTNINEDIKIFNIVLDDPKASKDEKASQSIQPEPNTISLEDTNKKEENKIDSLQGQ